MNKLKETITNKFAKEIEFSEKYKNSIFSGKDSFLDNIDIISNSLENKINISDVYSNEVKRTIFDNASPSYSLNMIWFICSHQDNLEIFKWACSGIGWLKGSEKNQAINPLKEYIKEYKPQEITKWLIGETHEDKDVYSVARNVSPYLLYAIENKDKKLQHQLVGRNIFMSNNLETYAFLKQTKDEHLFNKIMKKHFKNFHFYKDNIILRESDKDKEIKFYLHYFDENNSNDKLEKIKEFREMGFNNIADYINSYALNKVLEESLINKESLKKRIKI